MDNSFFYEQVQKRFDTRLKVMKEKGKEYTVSSDDKLQNFKRVAELTGSTPLQVWLDYTAKHFFSICNYVKTGTEASNESIEGRIVDLMNYLDLGAAIIYENKENLLSQRLDQLDHEERMRSKGR